MPFDQPIVQRIIRRLLRPAFNCRHYEYSLVCSADDDLARPSKRLTELFVAAARLCPQISLGPTAASVAAPSYYDVWPGEHYRLLAALMQLIKPTRVLEIGTYQGLSALTCANHLTQREPQPLILTNDIVDWRKIPGQLLTEQDFVAHPIRQILGDLSDPRCFEQHRSDIEICDLIFVDGPKDGRYEHAFLQLLNQAHLKAGALIVLDDIRLWNMLEVWRGMPRPKMDWTSIGHWSGTGVIDWHG